MTRTHAVNPVPQLNILDGLQIAQTFLFRVPWTIVSTLSRRWWPFNNYQPPPLKEHLFRHLMTWYDLSLSEVNSKNHKNYIINSSSIFENLPPAVIKRITVRDENEILDSIRYNDLKGQIFQRIQQEKFSAYWLCRGLSLEPIKPIDADVILLHVHGGGYVMGHPSQNAPELLFMAELLAGKGLKTAIFSLEYSLMPNGYFPTQIDQLFAAYEWIVHTMGVDASKILIMGESAGAHLVLSFLTFLSETSDPTSLPKPRAAFLLSPWANLRSDHPKTLALHWEDRLFKESLDASAKDFLRNATSHQLDLYESFATKNSCTKRRPWNEILPSITRVSAGSDELVFLYDIQDFVENAQEDGAEVSITIKEGVDHAWQSNEARGFHQRFLGQRRGSIDESIMPGYREVAQFVGSIFAPCDK
ncbi:uncharacterized protein N7484_001864 [Penicillium longicatenatum]|uniref:uncharacterized protein n=1 Tax=Penicillium longicatenatum TaxID=1561947 RepID=UPI002546A4EB|nr:uncharacterized protein N7484_001864 [Penicillium longicatenatum]KAJ5658215.1 hypothetical protein N7484_001864 [Penicillium longicatenatum]